MNKNRRKFLKLVLIGSTAFVAGKVFGPFITKFSSTSQAKASSAFRVDEDDQSFLIYDDTGAEVLQIDKTG